MKVLCYLSGRDKEISWCWKADGGVRAEIAQILGDIAAKKATGGKRGSGAAAATGSLSGQHRCSGGSEALSPLNFA